MTKRDILSLALKVIGIITVMWAILHIPSIAFGIGALFQEYSELFPRLYAIWHFVGTIITPMLLLVMAYVLLRWSDSISNRLVREDNKISISGDENWEKRIFVLALRINGVVALLFGIPRLLRVVEQLMMRWNLDTIIVYHSTFGAIGSIALVVLGLYLLFDGKLLIKIAFRQQKEQLVSSEGSQAKHNN